MDDAWRHLGVSVVAVAAQDYAKLLRERDRIAGKDGRTERLTEINCRIYAMEKIMNSRYFALICPEYDTAKLAEMVREKYSHISMRMYKMPHRDGDKRKAGDGYYNPNPKPRGRKPKNDWAW